MRHAAALCLLLLLSTAGIAQQAPTAATPAATEEGACQPAIAADKDGKLYLAYAAGVPRMAWLRTSGDNGATWSEPELASPGVNAIIAGMTRGPRLAISADGLIIITAHAKAEAKGDLHLYCFRKGPKDKAFAGKRLTTDAAKDSEGMHDMCMDGQGDIHVAWLDAREAVKGSQPWYARSTDGGKTFKGEMVVYKSPSGSICPCCAPSIAASEDGKTVVLHFRNQIKNSAGVAVHDVHAAVSTDGGKRWDAPARLDDAERWKKGCPMDGGQVAMSPDAKTQASTWMNAHDGKRRLFVFIGQPGKPPAAMPPIDLQGQQTHPCATLLDAERALVVFEQDSDSIQAVIVNKQGEVTRTLSLGTGNYPRVARGKDGTAVVTFQNDKGVQTRAISAQDLK